MQVEAGISGTRGRVKAMQRRDQVTRQLPDWDPCDEPAHAALLPAPIFTPPLTFSQHSDKDGADARLEVAPSMSALLAGRVGASAPPFCLQILLPPPAPPNQLGAQVVCAARNGQ